MLKIDAGEGRQVRAGQAHDRRKELKDVLDGALFGRRP